MIQNKFCNLAIDCKKSNLTRMLLVANGCPSHSTCEDFIKQGDKVREVVLCLDVSCSLGKCSRDNRERMNDDCIDCLSLRNDNTGGMVRKIEFSSRCLREFCNKPNKTKTDNSCLDCEYLRMFSTQKRAWTSFRGGKDIHGKNFKRK